VTGFADLRDKDDNIVANADFRELDEGILITLHAKDMPPGIHAIHIHAVGKCEAPDFAAGDDNVTDPSGSSGDRIACGVIVKGTR
jgi:superoxide dismutase, Cu-Zn family